MQEGKDQSKAHRAALLNAVKARPGTFVEIFAVAWPSIRRSYVGGEDLARMQSYDMVYGMMMRGQVNKVGGVYTVALPKKRIRKNRKDDQQRQR